MRALPFIISVASVLISSCTKPQATVQTAVPLQPGGVLSQEERISLAKIDPVVTWNPAFSALWGRGAESRHVCLYSENVGITWPYSVFVFDSTGQVTEANVILGAIAGQPALLLSVSPLRMTFVGGVVPVGQAATNGLLYSHDEGYRRAVERGMERQKTSTRK